MSLDAALSYRRSGWVPVPTFEIRAREGRPVCSCAAGAACQSPGKHPRVRWADLDLPDEAQIAAWWRRWPGAGVALRTGGATGLVVLDVDPDHGGDASLEALTRAEGDLPATLAVVTGGGGRHFYFSAPDAHLRNDAGRVLGPGLDIRADGGIVIAPPTRHVSGRRYEWTEGPLTPLPAWMATRLQRPDRDEPTPIPAVTELRGGATRYGTAALAEETLAVARAAEGSRNHTLNRAAFCIGQLVAGGEVAVDDAVGHLLSAAIGVGLPEGEARATIESGMTSGRQIPRRAQFRSTDPPERHNRTPDRNRSRGAQGLSR